ncbi:helix-turn-helix transcriptional regulator [Amphritea sp.]|uniref:helix-turn-helix domain-containing protein n=1 Tax=Amphritea sp. TaxID=1872502 RepID=UPI0025C532DB|nr:helix-turn-helix transcriptional regulator [Amphritea sp.]
MKDDLILKSIGDRIRQKRKEQGFTQEAFALIAGFERAYYGRVERGIQNLTILNLYKISKALKCTPDELIKNIP